MQVTGQWVDTFQALVADVRFVGVHRVLAGGDRVRPATDTEVDVGGHVHQVPGISMASRSARGGAAIQRWWRGVTACDLGCRL